MSEERRMCSYSNEGDAIFFYPNKQKVATNMTFETTFVFAMQGMLPVGWRKCDSTT